VNTGGGGRVHPHDQACTTEYGHEGDRTGDKDANCPGSGRRRRRAGRSRDGDSIGLRCCCHDGSVRVRGRQHNWWGGESAAGAPADAVSLQGATEEVVAAEDFD